jgi:hypothetical protein
VLKFSLIEIIKEVNIIKEDLCKRVCMLLDAFRFLVCHTNLDKSHTNLDTFPTQTSMPLPYKPRYFSIQTSM